MKPKKLLAQISDTLGLNETARKDKLRAQLDERMTTIAGLHARLAERREARDNALEDATAYDNACKDIAGLEREVARLNALDARDRALLDEIHRAQQREADIQLHRERVVQERRRWDELRTKGDALGRLGRELHPLLREISISAEELNDSRATHAALAGEAERLGIEAPDFPICSDARNVAIASAKRVMDGTKPANLSLSLLLPPASGALLHELCALLGFAAIPVSAAHPESEQVADILRFDGSYQRRWQRYADGINAGNAASRAARGADEDKRIAAIGDNPNSPAIHFWPVPDAVKWDVSESDI